jgi:hypothetical protein
MKYPFHQDVELALDEPGVAAYLVIGPDGLTELQGPNDPASAWKLIHEQNPHLKLKGTADYWAFEAASNHIDVETFDHDNARPFLGPIPQLQGRLPFAYNPENSHLVIGQDGWTHDDLIRNIDQSHNYFYGAINQLETRNGHGAENTITNASDLHGKPWTVTPDVVQAINNHLGKEYTAPEEEQWKFSSNEFPHHNWKPGEGGKGIIDDDGSIHTWNTHNDAPHHFQYLAELKGDPKEYGNGNDYQEGLGKWYERSMQYEPFHIEADGGVYDAHNAILDEHVGLNPKVYELPGIKDPKADWHFAQQLHPHHNWKPRNEGKGIVVDGDIHTWNTDDDGSPHHFQYLAELMGDHNDYDSAGGNYEKGFDKWYDKSMRSQAFHIDPEGSVDAADLRGDRGLDPRIYKLPGITGPGSGWNFTGSDAKEYPQNDPNDITINELEGVPGAGPDGLFAHRRVFAYDPDTATVHLSQPGAFHAGLKNELRDMNQYYGKGSGSVDHLLFGSVNRPEGNPDSEYETRYGSPGEISFIGDADYVGINDDHQYSYRPALEALKNHLGPEYYHDYDEPLDRDWHFAKTADWKVIEHEPPGYPIDSLKNRRPFVARDGVIHIGQPGATHDEVTDAAGLDWRDAVDGAGSIVTDHNEGGKNWGGTAYGPAHTITGLSDQYGVLNVPQDIVDAINNHLETNYDHRVPVKGWKFAEATPIGQRPEHQIVDVDTPVYEGLKWENDRKPVIHFPEENLTLVGSPGSHHETTVENFNKSPYNKALFSNGRNLDYYGTNYSGYAVPNYADSTLHGQSSGLNWFDGQFTFGKPPAYVIDDLNSHLNVEADDRDEWHFAKATNKSAITGVEVDSPKLSFARPSRENPYFKLTSSRPRQSVQSDDWPEVIDVSGEYTPEAEGQGFSHFKGRHPFVYDPERHQVYVGGDHQHHQHILEAMQGIDNAHGITNPYDERWHGDRYLMGLYREGEFGHPAEFMYPEKMVPARAETALAAVDHHFGDELTTDDDWKFATLYV